MTTLYIPACGDRITLNLPWTFTAYFERRNARFLLLQGAITQPLSWRDYYVDPKTCAKRRTTTITLPAGTTLEVARVYVRNTAKAAPSREANYDSITWKIVKPNGKASTSFWAKLSDVNKISFTLESTYAQRKATKCQP